MKRAERIKWIMGVAIVSCFALVSASRGETVDSGMALARVDRAGALIMSAPTPAAYLRLAASERMAYRYQYFPDAQVYFDPSRELFFYMWDGDWTKSPSLPRELRNRLGDFEMIDMDEDDPYADYQESVGSGTTPVEPPAREIRTETTGGQAPPLAYQYYYYPRDQVYFDPTNRIYFYFDGDRWLRSPDLPPRIHEPLGNHVILETDTDAPYVYHQQVLQLYFDQPQEVQPAETGPPAWEPVRGEPVYHYLYYPAASMYFDEDRHVYFFFTHNQWEESRTLPEYLSEHAGSPVELVMNTPEPYRFHSQVFKRYPHPGVAVNKTKPIFHIWSGKK